MPADYTVAWCPTCNHGWIEIVKNSATGELFLLCPQCNTSWLNPKDIPLKRAVAHRLTAPVGTPSQDEIKAAGWNKYIIGK